MAVTKDKVQLDLIINGNAAGATLKELNSASKQLNREIQNLVPGTEAFEKKAAELRTVNARLTEIRTDIKGVKDEMNNAGSGFKQFAGGVGDSLMNLAPLGAAAAGAFAVEKLIEFGQGAITAFNEAENAAFQAHNAFVTLGGETEAQFGRLMDLADKLEATTFGFSQQQITDSMQMLKVFGLQGDEIEVLIPQILDYAAVTKKDLGEATQIIIDGFMGSTDELQKAGLAFEEGAVSTKTMSDALTKFEGSASAALDVGTNKTEIFTDQWRKVQEIIGGFLVDVGMRVLDWVFELGAFYNGLYNQIQPVIGAIKDFFSGIAQRFPILSKFYDLVVDSFFPILNLPAQFVRAAAGVTAFVQTATQQWDNLKNIAVGVFGDIGSLIYTAFTDPLNIGKVIDNIKSKFTTAATDIGTNFQKNYEEARKKYTISAPEKVSTGTLTTDRKFKQETDDFKAESDKRTEIARAESEKRVATTTATVKKVVETEKALTVEQINDKNKELLKAADYEVELANKVLKAKADIAILAAKNDEELLQAKIEKLLIERNIELDNIELTAAERRLVVGKTEAEIAALRKDYAQKQLEAQQDWADKEVEIIEKRMSEEDALQKAQAEAEKQLNEQKRDAAISIAQGGLDALLQFSQMETDQKVLNYEKDRDARLKTLDEQFAKGTISEQAYNKKKEALEKDAAAKIAAIKTEQAKKDKAAAILQAAINTAVAITAGMATPAVPPFPSAIAAGILGALQIALIAAKPLPTFAKGGIAQGASHAQGGIKMFDSLSGQQVGEMEGGEPYLLLSKSTYGNNKKVIDRLLYSSMYKNGAPIFAKGGIFAAPMTSLPQNSGSNAAANDISYALISEISALRADVQAFNGRLKAYITYADIESTISNVQEIKKKANR
jgi:hypothetical protein